MLQLTISDLDKKTADAISVLAKKAGANVVAVTKKQKATKIDESHLEEFDSLITSMKKKYYAGIKSKIK